MQLVPELQARRGRAGAGEELDEGGQGRRGGPVRQRQSREGRGARASAWSAGPADRGGRAELGGFAALCWCAVRGVGFGKGKKEETGRVGEKGAGPLGPEVRERGSFL